MSFFTMCLWSKAEISRKDGLESQIRVDMDAAIQIKIGCHVTE
jgi:hypothetical protein